MNYRLDKEWVENAWGQTGFWNHFAVNADTGHRIAGTDAATEDDARWMCRHWYAGAKEMTEVEAAA